MTEIHIHQQIALLRKQNGMTQEQLANALGVSNQAVSKWESAQCFPDIQLLPELARLFHTSIDELMGYQPETHMENLVSELRTQIETLPEGEDLEFIFHIATALHTIIFTKIQNAGQNNPPFRDVNELIQYALDGEWGYSCYNTPSFTTKMTSGCIFFSNNQHLDMKSDHLNRIAMMLKIFSNKKNLKTAAALYQITFHGEDVYASIDGISRKSELPEETVGECLALHLSPYLTKKTQDGQTLYRFTGAYMELIPSLMMLGTFD